MREGPFEEMREGPCEVVLTLEGAVVHALDYNRQLLNNQDNAIKARFQLQMANAEFDLQVRPTGNLGYVGGGTAGSGPAFGTGMEFTKKLSYGTLVTVNPSILKAEKLFHTTLRALITQPLLRGCGKDYSCAGMYSAQFALRSASRSYYTAQCQTICKTIAALYDLLKAQINIVLNENSLQRIQRFYQAALVKSKIGLAEALDVYRAEIELRQAEDSLTNARERLQESEDTLRDILALPIDAIIRLDIPINYTPYEIDHEEAVEIALKNRVEIEQANDHREESVRLSKIAKDRLWPELNLVLNYSNIGWDQIFTESWRNHRESTWGVGFTTSTNFNPSVERAVYQQSLLAIEVANRGIDQATANVAFEVKRSTRQLERARQRIELQGQQIASSEGELRLAKLKFDRGMANNFDLIQAEKNLHTAQVTYWNAIIDHIVEEYRLRERLGLLMEKPKL